jgi:hypothetical protein
VKERNRRIEHVCVLERERKRQLESKKKFGKKERERNIEIKKHGKNYETKI